jgi:hypothetical protein
VPSPLGATACRTWLLAALKTARETWRFDTGFCYFVRLGTNVTNVPRQSHGKISRMKKPSTTRAWERLPAKAATVAVIGAVIAAATAAAIGAAAVLRADAEAVAVEAVPGANGRFVRGLRRAQPPGEREARS